MPSEYKWICKKTAVKLKVGKGTGGLASKTTGIK
jgi:hypothetical protein